MTASEGPRLVVSVAANPSKSVLPVCDSELERGFDSWHELASQILQCIANGVGVVGGFWSGRGSRRTRCYQLIPGLFWYTECRRWVVPVEMSQVQAPRLQAIQGAASVTWSASQ